VQADCPRRGAVCALHGIDATLRSPGPGQRAAELPRRHRGGETPRDVRSAASARTGSCQANRACFTYAPTLIRSRQPIRAPPQPLLKHPVCLHRHRTTRFAEGEQSPAAYSASASEVLRCTSSRQSGAVQAGAAQRLSFRPRSCAGDGEEYPGTSWGGGCLMKRYLIVIESAGDNHSAYLP
jgi:hypothetical protein